MSGSAQTISINGVAAPNPVTVVAGTAVPLTVNDGPGHSGDWVGLFAAGSDTRLAYAYLSGTGSQPATGLTSATFTTYAPLNAGEYEWRLFVNNSWTRIATSGVITVTASPATVRINGSASAGVAAGAQVSLSITDSPGNAGDWVGLFAVGSDSRLAHYYLSGTGSKPATGVTSATFPVTAPTTAGEYEWRLFLNDSWSRIVSSGVMTVTSPTTLSINGVAAPGPVTVVAGTQVALSVSQGPGNARDWVGLFAVGSDAYLAYYYLNGTGSAPAAGVTSATFPTYAPLAAGQYEWRLFANGSWSRVTASGVITVTASPAALRFNSAAAPGPVTAAAGAQVSLSVADSPGNAADWVGLFPVGSDTRIAYYYLNGTGSQPATGVTSATLPTYAPATPGQYEWRLFLNNSWSRITTSGVLTVTVPTTISVNGVLTPVAVAPGSPLSVQISEGPGNTTDWISLASHASSDSERIDWKYLSGSGTPPQTGLTSASLSFTAPTTNGTYELRLFAHNGLERIVTSALITVGALSTPTLSVSTGTYSSEQAVTVNSADAGVALHYTQNGNDPTESDATVASGATITIVQSSTLKVRAFKPDFTPSDIATATYSMEVAAPQISPASGTFTTPQSVTITTATAGATIRYTVDGSDPSVASALYSQALVIDTTTTVKARAFRANWADSAVASAALNIDDPGLRVIANTPAAGAVGVRNAVISATFSADMDPDSITQSTIMLDSVLWEYTLYTTPSYDAATRTVALIVDDWIEPLAPHRIRIVGGVNGVRSATGLLLDEDFAWTFTAASDDGVDGAWGFEEGSGAITADNSGNGNTGALLGPSWSLGRYGSGLTFDGVDDRVRIADADTLDASTEVSIAAWIKPSGTGPLNVIVSKGSLAADHSYALWLNASGQLSANFILSDGTFAATTTEAIATNVWTYVVATYDGSMIRLFVNLVEAASESASGAFENTNQPLWIGGDQSAGNSFAGQIDEVRVFDYALPEWEIDYWMSEPAKLVQTAGKLAGGEGHTLLAKPDGTVWAWGANGSGQLGDGSTADRRSPYQVPGLSNIVAVAAGRNHSMALAADGTAHAWGSNANGQIGLDTEGADQLTPFALPLTSVKAIAAGDLFSLVLRTNGEVYAFGHNAHGQFGDGSTAAAVATPILVATDAVAIAAGFNHSIIVKTDGTVWTAGQNDSGQLGNSSTTPSASWVQMVGITNGVAATAGDRHTVVLLADGTLMTVGINTSGQLGDSTTANFRTTAVPIQYLEDVTVIEAGANHTLAITADGTAWAWGQNTSGQLGNDSTAINREPNWLPFWYAAHFAAGHQHSVAVTHTGTVHTWGSNSSGQLGNGNASSVAVLVPEAISADGYRWRVAAPELSPNGGSFDNAQLVTLTSATPAEPGFPVTIRYTLDGEDPTESSLEATGPVTVDHSLVLKARAWRGDMADSSVNTATFTFQVAQPTVGTPAGTYTSALDDVQFLSATQGAEIRYTTNFTDPTASSTLYTGPIDIAHTTTYRIAAFKNGYAQSPVTLAHYTMNFGTLTAPVVEPASGTYLGSVSITTSTALGTVYYTANPATTAGSAPTGESSSETPFTSASTTTIRARSIHLDYTTSADTTRTYIIKANKPTLSATGGSYAPGSVVTITADQPFVDILRMTIDGSEPSDLSPQVASGTSILLGDFTLKVRAFRDHPDDIDGDTETAAYTLTSPMGPGSASAGGAHNLLATPDGRVFAWGRNANGQLGVDSTADASTPTMMNSITGVTAVSSGAAHSLARTWDGQVYSWGSNASGRLGDGATTPSTVPVHVSTLSNVVAVAAGDMHSLALTSDGQVYAWGENSDGQVGIGSTYDAWIPTLIQSLTNVVAIAAGGTHSLAVTASGQLYAWGNNASARLGDGTTTDRTNPVLIGVSDVVAVAAGGAHSLAMTSSGALYSWGLGTSGQLGHGAATSFTTPQLITGMHASAIAAGGSHSAAIRHDGVLVGWGAGSVGQIGDGATLQRNAPVGVDGPASISTLTLGNAHSMAVTPAGEIWTWGEVDFGRLGDAAAQDRVTPAAIAPTMASWAPAAPTLDVASGSFATAQTVTVLSSEAGAVIRYTLNGTEPADSDLEVPAGGALDISSPSQLRAKVFATGRAASATARANYVLQPPAPIVAPVSGSYLATQTVTIWGSGSSSVIRYTLDGSDPTATSTQYDVPFQVSVTTVVKAREFPTNGWNPSAIATSSLVFNGGKLDLPAATPEGGTFLTAPQVSLSTSAGASIRYTLNGSTPTASSTLYTGPITIAAGGATLKSKAFHPTLPASDVRTDAYVVDTTSPTITAQYQPALINGWGREPVEVSFICSDNAQLVFCSAPTRFTEEGPGQTATGVALDSVGHEAQLPVTVSLDFSPPTVTISSPIDGSITTSTTLQVTAQVSDAMSGVASVNCNGVAATVTDGQVTCTVALRPGRNAIAVAALDVAGHSSSAGLTITQVGTASFIRLTPSERTMVVNEAGTLALRDDFGVMTSGAIWYSTNEQIVTLSSDDPPTLTALRPGQATITATKNGLWTSATVTVVDGDSLSPGTVRWRVPQRPNTSLYLESPLLTHRIDAEGPDAFVVEHGGNSYYGGEYAVVAITSSGEELWRSAAPGVPLFGDVLGGVVAGLDQSCRTVFEEFEFCYSGLARFAGPVGTATWRYQSSGRIDRPAQGRDGAIYFIEHQSGFGVGKSVVILDGTNGRVTGRVPLANAVTDISIIRNASGSVCSVNYGHYEYEPKTLGPIIGSDGYGYLVEWREPSKTAVIDCPSGNNYATVTSVGTPEYRLLRVSPEGQVASTSLFGPGCPGACYVETLKQLLPDGIGGMLVVAEYWVGAPVYTALNATRIDEDGHRSDVGWPRGTRIELVGQAGKVYLNTKTSATTSSAKWVMDLQSGATLWSLPTDWQWRAATPDGGAAVERPGALGYFGADGQLLETRPSTLFHPVHDNDSVIGSTGTDAGLTAIVKPFANATRYGATYGAYSTVSNSEVITGFGDQYGAQAQRKPGLGIFAKSHFAFLDYEHVAIRVVPQFQEKWIGSKPLIFGTEKDEFGNHMATIGAGQINGSGCTGGVLLSEVNRPSDLHDPHTELEALKYDVSNEDAIIERLFAKDKRYGDNLEYDCSPANDGTVRYNSNSFAAGLLNSTGIQLPTFPSKRPSKYPGWWKPVPVVHFGPQ